MRCKRGWSVQPVEKGNEDGGYRKFGGCLDAYMDAHLKPNMMETSKQSERTIKIK